MGSNIKAAFEFFSERGIAPEVFFVLGSGIDLSAIMSRLDGIFREEYAQIPGFPTLTVAGHSGVFTFGKFDRSLPVAIFTGRKHIYEGSVEDAVFVSRLMAELGAEIGLFTSSMGAISYDIDPGDLVLLRDVLHFGGAWTAKYSPIAPTGSGRPFIPFDRELRDKITAASKKAGVCIKSGVAAFMTGPTYETPAEVEMLRRAGADVVSMSMAPEVTVASALGIKCAGIAVVTNRAGAHSNHREVIANAQKASAQLAKLIESFLESIAK